MLVRESMRSLAQELGNDFGDEFEFGLNVILDALTRSFPEHETEFAS
jgi:hypothetical protein